MACFLSCGQRITINWPIPSYHPAPLAMSSAKEPEGSTPVPLEVPEISPPLRRRLQQCYEHAEKLKTQPKQDYDYAHTLLAECVATDPGNLVYVEAFLDNLVRKFNNNKRGASMQLFVNRGAVKKAVAAKQWLEVLKAGPEILKNNPWDVPTLRAMAEACENLQLNEVELRYLKTALDGSPKDVEVCRHCARSLARMGQYDQAIGCWARVSELKKHDVEAQKMIGDLQVEKTKVRFGMITLEDRKKGGAASTGAAAQTPAKPATKAARPLDEMKMRPEPVPEPVAEPVVEALKKREVALTPRQQLERDLAQDPTAVEKYLALAEAYADEGKLGEAERALQRGLHASGNDLRIRERLEEMQILKARQQLAVADRRAQADADVGAQELAKQLKENLQRIELEIFGNRAERYPTEAKWKYELGVRLKRTGNYREGIKRLAEIEAGHPLAAATQLEIGECYQYLKQYPQAMQAYRQAITSAEASDQTDQLKLALYRGGVLGGALGEADARDLLKRVVELDPKYRDAQERLARAAGKAK